MTGYVVFVHTFLHIYCQYAVVSEIVHLANTLDATYPDY